MVQQVVLILHNARVNGLFLSSCYCLYLVLPVLPMPTYISGCWNGSHLHLSQTKPQIGDRSCSIPCLGSHCWGSASYPTANLLTRNLQNIYYIHIGLSSVVYTHEHWKVLYHLVLYIWIYILFEQLSHSKQFCSHPSGFSHNFVLILSKLITLWQLRGKKRGGGLLEQEDTFWGNTEEHLILQYLMLHFRVHKTNKSPSVIRQTLTLLVSCSHIQYITAFKLRCSIIFLI